MTSQNTDSTQHPVYLLFLKQILPPYNSTLFSYKRNPSLLPSYTSFPLESVTWFKRMKTEVRANEKQVLPQVKTHHHRVIQNRI